MQWGGNLSVSMATPFAFSTHMADRQSPEQGRLLNPKQQHGELPVWVQGDEEGPEAHSQSEPLDCQAADSTAAILWRRVKKARVGSTGCGVSFEKRGKTPTTAQYQTRLQKLPVVSDCSEERKGVCPVSLSFGLCEHRVFHGLCAIISSERQQHGQTAATVLKLQWTPNTLIYSASYELQKHVMASSNVSIATLNLFGAGLTVQEKLKTVTFGH